MASDQIPDRSRLVAAIETATIAAITHRERADAMEREADDARMELVALRAEVSRLRGDEEGYLTANIALHAELSALIREVAVLQAELAESRGRAS